MWLILLISSVFLGYSVLSAWRKEFTKIEKLFISFALGLGLASLLMFVMGLLKVPLTVGNILISIWSCSLLLSLISIWKSGNIFSLPKITLKRPNVVEIALLSGILFLILWSFTQTVNWPPFEWDTLALYDFRGKIFTQYHSLAQDYLTSQPNLTAYNYVYPFSTSLMHTLIYLGGGSNPQFIYSLYYAAIIFLLYACIRRRLSRLQSLVFAGVIASTPEILFPSTIAYPNIPYALYFSFSTIYFWEWMIHHKNGYLVVSAIFLGLSAWLRNSEPFWVVNIVFILWFLLRQKKFFLAGIYLALFLPVRQLWPTYQNYIFSHASDIVFSPPQSFVLDITKIPEVLGFVLQFFIKDWLGYLAILIISFISLRKTVEKYHYIYFWLGGYLLLSIVGTYFFSVSFPWWNQIGGSAARISIFFAPLFLYALSLLWPNSLKGLSSYFKEAAFSLIVEKKKWTLIRWPRE